MTKPYLTFQIQEMIRDLLVDKGFDYRVRAIDLKKGIKEIELFEGPVAVMIVQLDGHDFDCY